MAILMRLLKQEPIKYHNILRFMASKFIEPHTWGSVKFMETKTKHRKEKHGNSSRTYEGIEKGKKS